MRLCLRLFFVAFCLVGMGKAWSSTAAVDLHTVIFKGKGERSFCITDNVRKASYSRHTTIYPGVTKAQALSLLTTDRGGVSCVIVFEQEPYPNFMKNRADPRNPIEHMVIQGVQNLSSSKLYGNECQNVEINFPKQGVSACFMEQTPVKEFAYIDGEVNGKIGSVLYVVKCVFQNSLDNVVLDVKFEKKQACEHESLYNISHVVPKIKQQKEIREDSVKYFKIKVPVTYKTDEDSEEDDENHKIWNFPDENNVDENGSPLYYREDWSLDSLVVTELTQEDFLWAELFVES